MTAPRPNSHSPTPDDLAPILRYIREHFYTSCDCDYQRDRRALLLALTWPAAWLHSHGLRITCADYNQLLLRKIQQIKRHGNPANYGGYFPRYLMKSLQDHCRHHHEAIYNKLKHASYTIDQITDHIAQTPRIDPTTVLAQAHEILRQNQRTKDPPNPSNQMTLGL